MALSFPYPLAFLSDVLKISEATMSVARSTESSGAGTGQYWEAELAPPLWQAEVPLAARSDAEARAIDAKIRRLGGNKLMLFADPSYPGIDAEGVTIASISDDLTALALTGLPAGQEITAGQRLSVDYGDSKIWLGEFSEDMTADADGTTEEIGIYPPLPMSVAAGDAVELAQPRCKMRVESKTGFTMEPGSWGQGATLTLKQKP